MQRELFTRMQYEPSVLMLGKKYRKLSLDVLAYNWNAIITTNCELEMSSVLKNDRRFIQDVVSKNDMQENLLDKKNLHIIRLFGEQ